MYKSCTREKFINGQLEKENFLLQEKAKNKLNTKISLKPNLLSTFFDSIVFDKSIITEVKKIIGANIFVWSSAFFAKASGEGKIVSFHQGNPCWQLTTTNVVTAWVALTESNDESDALQLVPNSHNFGLIKKLNVTN